MGFLFPLFLIAGLSLAIPVLIHLFNLRKYKRIAFPDTRFLRSIQLSTKRQAKVRNWRLLLLRMLFLASLVLAFAQPYFGRKDRQEGAAIAVVYIDNSYSMTMADGQENLLQQARRRAKQLMEASGNNARFVLVTNDRRAAGRPMLRNEALQALQDIKPVAQSMSLAQLMNQVNAGMLNEKQEHWNLYCFTDLQKSTFLKEADKIAAPELNAVYVYTLQAKTAANLYIDTAYFLSPNLDTRQPNPLVVRVKKSGSGAETPGNLQVSIGDQVRAVSRVDMESIETWTDTMDLQLSASGWQDITLALQDHPLRFDDTFRIAARTAPEMSVLVVTENSLSPFLQTALRTYEGFKVAQEPVQSLHPGNWQQYGLIILQNLSALPDGLQQAVKAALQRGQNVLLFPGDITNLAAYNQALQQWGDLRLEPADTASQQVVSMQEHHPLLQDLFEKVPDNVQLPTTVRRYPVDASLTAGQQSLMSFRDGKPFLAQYTLQQGKLYFCASSLDDHSSNFAVSYFFVPLLYKMAIQGGTGNMFALSIGSPTPLWLPVAGSDDRKVWHISRPGFDAIPSQRPSGVGVELFLDKAVNEPGFYRLYSAASPDTVHVGLNQERSESLLEFGSEKEVETALGGTKVHWIDERTVAQKGWNQAKTPFPFWKVAALLGLLCLGAETYLLLKKKKAAQGSPGISAA